MVFLRTAHGVAATPIVGAGRQGFRNLNKRKLEISRNRYLAILRFRDLFGMVSLRDLFGKVGFSDLQGSGMKFGHFVESPGTERNLPHPLKVTTTLMTFFCREFRTEPLFCHILGG